jgi:aminopeptidase
MDDRVKALASLLVGYSLKVKRGEVVKISGTELAKPLILAAYEEVIKKGAYPLVDVFFDEANEIFYREGSGTQLDYLSPVKLYAAKKADAALFINSPSNTRMLTGVRPVKITRVRRANKPVSDIIMKKVRWVLVNFPTRALAQEAEMSLAQYEDFLFRSCLVDWKTMKKDLKYLKRLLERSDVVKIVGKDTDITFSIKGRKAIVCAGESNMPDGEIFTAPVEGTVEGRIYYDFPAIFGGREVSGIRLRFERGKVVEAEAEKNGDLLLGLLDTDRGARIPGEFGIGYNYGIDRFTRDILFDEKIGGTIHIALGKSYAESGGKNDSALHWDMIKDLRKDGAIYLDDRAIMEKGKFHFKKTATRSKR